MWRVGTILINWGEKREGMVRVIRDVYGFEDEGVLDVMLKVPRHEFAPKKFRDISYDDTPISIGYGQTMSQPYTVAMMTHLATETLNSKHETPNKFRVANPKFQKNGIGGIKHNTKHLTRNTRVLEIGTGSGYQAAILSYFFHKVYSIEIVPELAHLAKIVFARLGYENIFVKAENGKNGWKRHAPFDAIIITAAIEKDVPKTFLEQLKVGGVAVVPIGPRNLQVMTRFTKLENGELQKEEFQKFIFVPFVEK